MWQKSLRLTLQSRQRKLDSCCSVWPPHTTISPQITVFSLLKSAYCKHEKAKHVWWVRPNIEYRVVPWSVALSASAVLDFLFEINRNATFCRAAKQQSLFWVILLRKSLQVFYSNQTQLIYLFNKVKSAAAGFGLDKNSADSSARFKLVLATRVLQLDLIPSWSRSTHSWFHLFHLIRHSAAVCHQPLSLRLVSQTAVWTCEEKNPFN